VRLLPVVLLGATTASLLAFVAVRAALGADVSATIRIAVVCLAMAGTFGITDDAAIVTAATPAPLWLRRAWRLAAVLAWTASSWAAVLAVARITGPASTFPADAAALTAQLAMLAAAGLGAGLIVARRDERAAGPVGSAVVIVIVLGAVVAPVHWPVALSGEPALLQRDLLRVLPPALGLAWIGVRDPGAPRRLAMARARRGPGGAAAHPQAGGSR
jgi:hypothetical protein